MSDPPKPFSIDLASLETRRKDISDASVERADSAGEQHGFVNREPPRKWGRRPRTGQVHAKVMPNIADEIGDESRRRGVQPAGVLIDEAWALYKAARP